MTTVRTSVRSENPFDRDSLGTGDDDAEMEDDSPMKQTKGKPGRKPGQKQTAASKKGDDHESENQHGSP